MNLKRWTWLLALLAVIGLVPQTAEASHFRYGTLNWQPTGVPNEVKVNFRVAFRRAKQNPTSSEDYYLNALTGLNTFSGPDGYPVTGDLFYDFVGFTFLTFGENDAVTGILPFKVTSYSVAEDWIVAEMIDPDDPLLETVGLKYRYTGPGPFTILAPNARRIDNLNNRPGRAYHLSTTVNLQSGNSSPVATQVPIVVAVDQGATATFPVPAVDSDLDYLQWRFASDQEAIGLGSSTPPPNTYPPNTPSASNGAPADMSINPNTGIVTWNTLGKDTGNFYTVQFIVEDWTAPPSQGGVLKNKIPVDFLLKVRPRSGSLPVSCGFDPMQITTILAEVGSPITFDVSATDADPGEQLTFTTAGLPSSATLTPALPFTGPSGSTVTFSWTPGFGDLGSYVLLFAITDRAGQQAFCVRRITVVQGGQNQPPSIAINPQGPLFVTTGNAVDFDVTGTDPDPSNTVILTALSGLPPGATMTPVLPTAGPASGVTSHFHWASAQAGTYVITYRATDDYGATATKSITLQVALQAPPVLAITPAGPLSVQHNATVSFTVTGTDPNAGDSVTVAVVSGLPAGATMSPVLPTQGPASGVSSSFTWVPTLLQLGQHTITYSATDLMGNTVSSAIVINVVPGPNTPPALVINPAGPITVIEGAPIAYVVTGTDTDPLDIVTLSLAGSLPAGATMTPNLPASGPGAGFSSTFNWTTTHPETVTVSYRVTDIIGAEATGSITLFVTPNPNRPPVADAGSDQTFDCSGPTGLSVHLDGVASSDPNGDPLQYTWTGPFGTLSGASITVTLPLGQTTVLLTVSDGKGGIASDSTVVTIRQDSDAPVFAMNTASMTLWPADHSYHTIGIADCIASVIDACEGDIDLRRVKIIKVSSDESEDLTCPPDSGGGSGDDDDDHGSGGGSGDDDDDNGSGGGSGDDDDDNGSGGGSGDDDDDNGSGGGGHSNGDGCPNNDHSKGNNGVGNGYDPQPPGNPPVNDGHGTSPGNPGKGGGSKGGGSSHSGSHYNGDGCPKNDHSKGNNGLGNGYDPQPPGNPRVNDGHGTSPGNPGNKGGGSKAKKSSARSNKTLTLVTSSSSSSSSHDDDDDNSSGGGSQSGGGSHDDDDDNSSGGGSQSGGSSHDDDDDNSSGGDDHNGDNDDDHNGDDDDDHNGSGVCAADNDVTGDGATKNDILISADSSSVQLRAERNGAGNGRVYTITFQVTDSKGNVATAECKVSTPVQYGQVAVDDGAGAGYTVYAGQPSGGKPIASSSKSKSGLSLKATDKAAGAASKPAVEKIEELAAKPVVPTVFALKANFPNPFNPSTTIAYDVPVQAQMTIEVYNLLGQVVVQLVNEYMAAGSYTVTWNGMNANGQTVASGTYIYRIVSSTGFTQTKRMTLLK